MRATAIATNTSASSARAENRHDFGHDSTSPAPAEGQSPARSIN
jgi:hypothetical protein